MFVEPVTVDTFDCLSDPSMQAGPPGERQPVVDGRADESVSKPVTPDGPVAHEPGSGGVIDRDKKLVGGNVVRGRKDRHVELKSGDGGELQDFVDVAPSRPSRRPTTCAHCREC